MSAIRRAKILARERVALQDVIPLEVPFSIQIDICSACNMKCAFCFHSDVQAVQRAGVKFGAMSYDVFVKIIDDMKYAWGEQKVKKLRLFKIGEPLINKDVCRMVKYAKDANVAECVEITTNGTLLNEEMSLGLINAGLDILNISINGIDEKQYEETCQYKMNFDEYRDKIKFFYENRKQCKVFLKYSDIGYSADIKEEFYTKFQSVCDEIFVETVSATLWQDTNVGDKIIDRKLGTYGQQLKCKQVCPFLFTTMVINHQGIAHLCCVDWKSEYVLGDLKEETIDNVWNGEKLRIFQKLHLNKQKDKITLCRNCESLSANTTDDIDNFTEEILKRIT